MAKSRKRNVSSKRPQPPKKKGIGAVTWIAGAVALLAVVAIIAIVAGGGSKGAAAAGSTSTASATASSAGSVPADEQKYIGRLLPAGFTEAAVASASTYSSTYSSTDVTATQDKKQISVSVSDVVAKKIVYFEYKKAGSDPIPMVAYVKPSGKLFVGVGYCIPCKGTRQRIDADGTLTCESCGTKRDLETGVGISGTCRLYPLDEVPAKVSGGKIVVQDSVLDGWTAQPEDRPIGA
jgi:nitrite reductase/ring-hydroxylating ferredoxin subunit